MQDVVQQLLTQACKTWASSLTRTVAVVCPSVRICVLQIKGERGGGEGEEGEVEGGLRYTAPRRPQTRRPLARGYDFAIKNHK